MGAIFHLHFLSKARMADTTANVIGIQDVTAPIGADGNVTVSAGTTALVNTNSATGTTVEGTAYVTADTINQVGALDSTVSVGDDSVITVNEVSTTTASATNVGGAGPRVDGIGEVSLTTTGPALGGEIFSVSVNGVTYSYQASVSDTDVLIIAGLVLAINAGAANEPLASSGTGKIVLTQDPLNTSPGFTASSVSQTSGVNILGPSVVPVQGTG